MYDLIIVGAGACGLMAARELSRAGKKALILEARDRIGGRIYTFRGNGFTIPIEAGAEFIHGDAPVTIKILKEYGIPFFKTGGEFKQVRHRKSKGEMDGQQYHELAERLNELKQDIPVDD